MSFPRYPRYKSPDVDWMEEAPDHWDIRYLRSLARNAKNAFIDGDWIESDYITDRGVRLIQTGNIGIGKYKEQGFRYISAETFAELGCTEVEVGDVLICRLAAPVGRACQAPPLPNRMITSVDVCILKPDEVVDPAFLVYRLSAADYLGYMDAQCRGGTRDRVSRSFLATVPISLPGRLEQRAIAHFLDRETGKIDALVSEQLRLVELLNEKRQAIVSQVMTKGLNPNVPMKPSGVDWISEIPEHWTVAHLARIADRVVVGIAEAATHAYVDEGIPILRSTNIRPGTITGEILSIGQEFADARGGKRINAGDLVTVRTGNAGVTAVVPETLDGCQCFTMLITTLSKERLPDFHCRGCDSRLRR